MPVEFGLDLTLSAVNPALQLFVLGDLINVSQEWARDVRTEAQVYPARLPKQRYVRTYRLRRGWTVSPTRLEANGDIVTEILNDVPYAPKVHGDSAGRGQARIHAGRWRYIRDIGTTVSPSLEQRAQAALNRRIAGAIITQTIRVT
jgi:hypothetical protein